MYRYIRADFARLARIKKIFHVPDCPENEKGGIIRDAIVDSIIFNQHKLLLSLLLSPYVRNKDNNTTIYYYCYTITSNNNDILFVDTISQCIRLGLARHPG